jgi:hypothetical protein
MTTLTIIRRGTSSLAAATALLALAPSSGGAAVMTFGSKLTAAANVTEARQADTVYWQTAFADHRSPHSPATGQIKSIKIKGIAISNWKPGSPPGGETMFHLQALRKRPGGSYKILRTSQAFFLPGKGANPQKITTYRPTNFCIAKGDTLAFNTVGGWDGIVNQTGPYPMGTPLAIFSKVPGATVSEYTRAGATNNGAIIKGSTSRGTGHELLMQATVGTKANATGLCPGGTGR